MGRDREILLFGEDVGHERVVGTLVDRVARESGVSVRLQWRSATGGRPRLIGEYREYLRRLPRDPERRPDFIVVATDSNCEGLVRRERDVDAAGQSWPGAIVKAIPDPHIERWLLLDGAAFRAAVGKGCQAPDLKCDRDRYKKHLIESVLAAGVTPLAGGIEYATDIIEQLDLKRASRDPSFRRFIESLRQALKTPPDRSARPAGAGRA